MWFAWFQHNAWIATWLMLAGFSVTEGILVYLIYSFLGRLTSEERENVAWKLQSLGQLSAADKARKELERESGT